MTYQPFEIIGADRASNILMTCDHAANTVPESVNGGNLGLPSKDMGRHIAYDVGAAGVTREMAQLLDAPALLSNFSRLVIDPNRGEDDPTLLMRLYDGTIIPANRHADMAEQEKRLNAFHRPYHAAQTELMARGNGAVLVSIHSFTRQLVGSAPRPWHIGILHGADSRLAAPFIAILQAEEDICVGINEPYGGHLPGDSVDRHAIDHGRHNVLIEIRNDLIETKTQQIAWARRLAPLLARAMEKAGC